MIIIWAIKIKSCSQVIKEEAEDTKFASVGFALLIWILEKFQQLYFFLVSSGSSSPHSPASGKKLSFNSCNFLIRKLFSEMNFLLQLEKLFRSYPSLLWNFLKIGWIETVIESRLGQTLKKKSSKLFPMTMQWWNMSYHNLLSWFIKV